MGTQLARARRGEDARDRALIRKASRGDKLAIEALYRQYCDRIYQSCLRICREPEDAIDATQDTFLKVFRRLEELDPETLSFRDYLFASARNACFKVISKRKRIDLKEKVPEPKIKITDAAYADPERSLMIGDQQKIVRHASTELSARHYQALVMYELDGLGYADIGKQLDLDANAVGQLIMRARQRLRVEVQRCSVLQTDDGKHCARARVLLPGKTEGRLSDREAQWIDQHLDNCEVCAINLSLMQEVGAGYRAVLPPALIGLLWLRTKDALASTSQLMSDQKATEYEPKDSVTHSNTGQALPMVGSPNASSAHSRSKRPKRVVVLTSLIFVLLAPAMAGSEYLLKKESQTNSGSELSLFEPGIGQFGTPSGVNEFESLGIAGAGEMGYSAHKKQPLAERIDNGSDPGKPHSNLQGSRSKSGAGHGADSNKRKTSRKRRSSGGGSSLIPSAEQQAGALPSTHKTSNGFVSSDQRSSSVQQESSDGEANRSVPKASPTSGSGPNPPQQLPNSTPPIPSIDDAMKPKLPVGLTVKSPKKR